MKALEKSILIYEGCLNSVASIFVAKYNLMTDLQKLFWVSVSCNIESCSLKLGKYNLYIF